MPLLEFLRSAREALTIDELWEQIEVLRKCGCDVKNLPVSQSELRRSLRVLKMAGSVKEVDGKWTVVYGEPERKNKPVERSLF